MTSPSQAHDPCLRNVGCIFTRNHTGYCSTFSPSSVPVPRPSETPLPTTQEECDAKVAAAHTEISALCHGKRWLMSIPVRPEADSDTIICDALRALKDRVKILEAELARRSPSVPTATQDDSIRGRAFIAGFMAGYDQRAVGGVEPHELVRARAEEKANRYVAAYKPAKLDKPITPAVASSEEAANSDSPEIQQLRGAVWALADTLARRCLVDANASREAPNDWPAGQTWNELVGTSHSIMRGRAYAEALLDRRGMIALLCDEYGNPKPFTVAPIYSAARVQGEN